MSSAIAGRIYFMDAARALCMIIGIPYHAALVYKVGSWRIASPDKHELINIIAQLIHCFRMPAFFVISGFFAAMILQRRSPADWLLQRTVRLGIPFFFALLLLNPIFLSAEIAMRDISSEPALSDVPGMLIHADSPILHLWFLPVIFCLSALLCLLTHFRLFPRVALPASERRPVHPAAFFALGLVLLVIWEIAIDLVCSQMGLKRAMFGVINIGLILAYLPYFLIGAVMFSTPVLLAQVLHRNIALDVVCGLTVLAYLFARKVIDVPPLAHEVLGVCAAVAMIRLLLGTMYRYFNTANPLIRKVAEQSFSVYLIHMPVIAVFAFALLFVGLSPLIEFLILVAVSTIASFAFAAWVDRSTMLKLMFNGIVPDRVSAFFPGRMRRVVSGKG